MTPRAFFVRVGRVPVGRGGAVDVAATADDVAGLAGALASSPAWRSVPDAVLVVRPGPPSLLAVVGRLDDAAAARVEALPWQLADLAARARYVAYSDVERDCATLAARLVDHLGADGLAAHRFEAIPRGGLVVLGLLAYLLGLRPDQLHGEDDGRPCVLVDDCALSGSRLRRHLRARPLTRVVFAPLYAAAELRSAIEREEPRVRACLSAADLRDHAPQRRGEDYDAWRRRWRERSPDDYWTGDPDHVCFPWNEPDAALWNPVLERVEPGWRVVPPELCVKNRIPGPQRLQVNADGPGPLRPAADVIHAVFDGATVAAAAASGASVELRGSAAAIWDAVVAHGTVEGAVAALRGTFDVGDERLHQDASALVASLRARGLLQG